MHKFNLCHLLYLLQDSVWSLGLSILKHIIRHIRKSLPMFQLFQFFNASSKCGLNYMMHITDWTIIDIDIRHVGHCLTTFLDSFTLATNFLLEIETLFYSPPPSSFYLFIYFLHTMLLRTCGHGLFFMQYIWWKLLREGAVVDKNLRN